MWSVERNRKPRVGRVFLLAVVASALALLAACGSDPTPTPAPTATPTPAPVATPTPTPDLFLAEWDELIAAAQAEGQLLMAGGGGTVSLFPVYEIFAEKYGIEVTWGRGSAREISERLMAEQAAGRFEVDTLHAGGGFAARVFVPNNIVQPIMPFIIHPEVLDKSLWFGGHYWWTDPDQLYQFIFGATPASSSGGEGLWWNTDLVEIEEVAAWKDHWDPLSANYEGEGQVITASISGGHSTGSLLEYYLDPNKGPAWLERFYHEMDNFQTSDLDAIIDGVAKGGYRFTMYVGTANRFIRALGQQGAPVMEYQAAFNQGLVPGLPTLPLLKHTNNSGSIMIARNNPNPNATKLFTNWLLSREGQIAMHETEVPGEPAGTLHDEVSLRVDIPVGLTDPLYRWDPNVRYATVDMNPKLGLLQNEVVEWLLEIEQRGELVARPFEPDDFREELFTD